MELCIVLIAGHKSTMSKLRFSLFCAEVSGVVIGVSLRLFMKYFLYLYL